MAHPLERRELRFDDRICKLQAQTCVCVCVDGIPRQWESKQNRARQQPTNVLKEKYWKKDKNVDAYFLFSRFGCGRI